MPKDKICHGDWKMREKYFQTFDYSTNALYGLRTADGIFDGQARVWLDPSVVDKDASARLIHLRKCWRGVALKPTALWITSPDVSMPI